MRGDAMPVFIEYEVAKAKYLLSQVQYDEVLTEIERLFQMTQPKAVQYDKDRVSGGQPSDLFASYVIAKEGLDQKLLERKAILYERMEMVELKEQELRQSHDEHDKVYCMVLLDGIPPKIAYQRLYMGRSTLYRKLKDIFDVRDSIQFEIGNHWDKNQYKM